MTLSMRVGAGVAALAAIAAAGGLMLAEPRREPPPRTEAEKPVLMLLTSLPLVFPETFGLQEAGSPVLGALQERYRVRSIPVADAENLKDGRILLMAHARAQPATALVELDSWVREGGRLLLLADPMLEWESKRPLGDSLRPSPMFPDTGLLGHWGLRLDAPESRGPAERSIGSRRVLTASPGALFGSCAISADRLVARCRIGAGQAVVIADADFLDVEGVDGPTDRNLDALIDELGRLEPVG